MQYLTSTASKVCSTVKGVKTYTVYIHEFKGYDSNGFAKIGLQRELANGLNVKNATSLVKKIKNAGSIITFS